MGPPNTGKSHDIDRRSVQTGAITLGAGVWASKGMAMQTSDSQRTAAVPTSNGPVRGSVERGIQVFKGLRYGTPTGGPNRFMPPQKPAAWTEVADALAYGNSAPQGLIPGLHTDRCSPIAELMGGRLEEVTSENCLFLNLRTQGLGDGRKRPVMVWLHGGGFAVGSGSAPLYDGGALSAQGDAVVITLNHVCYGGRSEIRATGAANADLREYVLMATTTQISPASFVPRARIRTSSRSLMIFGDQA